jgi:hypothetical protein
LNAHLHWYGTATSEAVNHGEPGNSFAAVHGLLALRDLPAAERAVWRNLFDYYVFQTSGDPLAHLPPTMRGLMGARNPEQLREIRALLAHAPSRP